MKRSVRFHHLLHIVQQVYDIWFHGIDKGDHLLSDLEKNADLLGSTAEDDVVILYISHIEPDGYIL